jgi:hypothetical protein
MHAMHWRLVYTWHWEKAIGTWAFEFWLYKSIKKMYQYKDAIYRK